VDWVRAEIDGVPVFWSQEAVDDDADGDLRVGLVFRVGQADEPLPQRGITHLVEHLALRRVGLAVDHVNGEVDATTTTFFRHGSADEVVSFVRLVCESLRALPTDRAAAEVQLLRTEAAGRSPGPLGPMLIWRYGAATYGMSGYAEFGLGHHTPDALQEWADQWFTRGNAVLWLVGGPPPAGLRVDLPDGPRMPPPRPSSALPCTPAFFPERADGVGMLSVVERGAAAMAYGLLLRKTLYQVLRSDLGVSYGPGVSYDRRDARDAHIVAFADGLPEVHERLVAGFVDVLDRLVDTPPLDADVAEVTTTLRRRMTGNRAAPGLAVGAAMAHLVGAEPVTSARLAGEIDELTAADVRAVAATVRENALLMVPSGVRPPGDRYVLAPQSAPGTVEGQVLLPVGDGRARLVVGPVGVTRVVGRQFTTVSFAECRLVLAWPDGSRQLFDSSGFTVHVDPSEYQDGQIATSVIDRFVPSSVVLVQPARPAKTASPSPVPAAVPPPPPTGRRGLFRRR
jgi:zinc protease